MKILRPHYSAGAKILQEGKLNKKAGDEVEKKLTKSKYSPQTCREMHFYLFRGEIVLPYSAAKRTFISFTAK